MKAELTKLIAEESMAKAVWKAAKDRLEAAQKKAPKKVWTNPTIEAALRKTG